MHYIYKITNLVNGKIYIGQTNNIASRWRNHKSDSKRQKNYPLYNAMNKYGLDNFTIECLDVCESLAEVNIQEQWFIMTNLSLVKEGGYNIELGGKNKEVSFETRQKLSVIRKGKKPSLEARQRMSDAKKGCAPLIAMEAARLANKGHHRRHSKETINKIKESVNAKGKTWKLIDGKRVWLERNYNGAT